MMECCEVMAKAAAWVEDFPRPLGKGEGEAFHADHRRPATGYVNTLARGWRRKLANEREFARELLEHASIELRVLNGPNG